MPANRSGRSWCIDTAPPPSGGVTPALQGAVEALAPPFAHAAVAVASSRAAPHIAIASAPGIAPLTPEAPFRAASITKIVTGQTVWAVLADHPGALDADAGVLLGARRLSHPAGCGVTPRQLLSHTSGLWDAAGYLVPPDQDLAGWLAARGPEIWSPDRPGTAFRYCNLGYLLAAAIAERLAGDRLDALARRHVLGPHGIAAGFNWAGLPRSARAARVPCVRRGGSGALVAQIDADVADRGASGPDGVPIALDALPPGRAALRLSPQGGLRLSLRAALDLGRALPAMAQDRLWCDDQGPCRDAGLPVTAYGPGLMHFYRPEIYPRPLFGHFANAYGLCGGLWFDAGRDTAFIIMLNGLPEGDEDDAVRPEERALLAAVATALET